jgi:hypothetical protein
MKKLIIYSFLSLFLVSSCRKSDNERVPELAKVPFPLVLKADGDQIISFQNPDAFSAKFSVGLFFPDGVKPQKFDVVIRKNEVNASAKLYKADVTTFPTTFSLTGADLKTLFGPAISLGDKFDVGVDITTTDGKKYQAFPTVGVAYSSGAGAPAGASLLIRYEVVCKFNAADYAGNFELIEDEWADFGKGSIVAITVVSPTQLSFISPVNGKPIIIDVDPNTNETTIKKQEYGDYKVAGIDPTWTYGMSSVATIKSLNNFVAPCDLVISLLTQYTTPSAGFKETKMVFKKKP